MYWEHIIRAFVLGKNPKLVSVCFFCFVLLNFKPVFLAKFQRHAPPKKCYPTFMCLFLLCSQGRVNKLGISHVGCLVHGCFNASIPKPNLVSMETWRDAGPRIGAELEFEVTALDADTVGVLLIRGRLDRTRQVERCCVFVLHWTFCEGHSEGDLSRV